MKHVTELLAPAGSLALVCALYSSYPGLAGAAGNIAHGKLVFERATCSACHFEGGNVMNPAKPIKGAAFAKKYTDDQSLIKVIRSGVPNTSMAPFPKNVISDADMADLVAYVRSLTPKK